MTNAAHARASAPEWCAGRSSRARTCRPAGAGADQIRASHQPEDGQGARPRSANLNPFARRRGDRISGRFAAIAHSRFWHIAETAPSSTDGRYRERSGPGADVALSAVTDPKETFATNSSRK